MQGCLYVRDIAARKRAAYMIWENCDSNFDLLISGKTGLNRFCLRWVWNDTAMRGKVASRAGISYIWGIVGRVSDRRIRGFSLFLPSTVILLPVKTAKMTSEKTSDCCPFQSFLILINRTWVLTNSLWYNNISL
jgi:hypothetical protein